MRRMAIGCLVLAALMAFIVTPALSAEVKQYKFGGGTSGGPWFVGVGAAVPVINQHAQGKFSITYGASAGSVENVRRAATYEYDTGFAHVTTLYEALTATGSFKGRKVENLRLIAKVMDLTHIWAALKDSSVKSLRRPGRQEGQHRPPRQRHHRELDVHSRCPRTGRQDQEADR